MVKISTFHIYHNRPTVATSNTAIMMNAVGALKYIVYCTVLNKSLNQHLQRLKEYEEWY